MKVSLAEIEKGMADLRGDRYDQMLRDISGST